MPPVHDLVKSAFFGPSYSDADITRALVIGGFAFTAVQFLVTVVIPAPYGRYAKRAPSYTKCETDNTIVIYEENTVMNDLFSIFQGSR